LEILRKQRYIDQSDRASVNSSETNYPPTELLLASFEAQCRRRRSGISIPRLRLGELNDIRLYYGWNPLPESRLGEKHLEITINYMLWVYPEKEEMIWRIALLLAPWGRDLAIKCMNRHPRKWKADKLSKYLEIPEAVRIGLDLRTIGSKDITAEQRKEARKEAKRADQAKTRQENGATPRSCSASATRPWIAAGFKCRRTWERHGKPSGNDVANSYPMYTPCPLSYIVHEIATPENKRGHAGGLPR
jgi:hypothetical protein